MKTIWDTSDVFGSIRSLHDGMPLYVVSSSKGTNYVPCIVCYWRYEKTMHKERTAGNGPEQGKTVTFPEWTAAKDAFAVKWLNTNEAQWWEHSPPSFARSHM